MGIDSPKKRRTQRRTASAVERYTLNVVGSALRHSFRTPLSLIVNALKEVSFEIEKGNTAGLTLNEIQQFNTVSLAISGERNNLLAFYKDLGSRFGATSISGISVASPPITSELSLRLLKHDVQDRLRHIHKLCSEATASVAGARNDEIKRFRNMVVVESNRMLRVLSGMIQLAEMPANLKTEEVSLNGRIETAARQVESNFRLQGSGMRINYPTRMSVQIEAARSLLDLLFQNLLENAVRYALRAEYFNVNVGFNLNSAEALREKYADLLASYKIFGDWVEVHVRNSGPAIPPALMEKIFQLYHTTEAANETSTGGGSGIGLALCRLICAIHGGFVFVDRSNENQTDFCILIPEKQINGVPPTELLQQLTH